MTTAEQQKQVAERIDGELAAQARAARAVGLDTLAYLLDMARLEAGQQSGRAPDA
ncbi:MAG: hypothetical protein WDO17_13710 [Alphaproteobacteria bacterium]